MAKLKLDEYLGRVTAMAIKEGRSAFINRRNIGGTMERFFDNGKTVKECYDAMREVQEGDMQITLTGDVVPGRPGTTERLEFDNDEFKAWKRLVKGFADRTVGDMGQTMKDYYRAGFSPEQTAINVITICYDSHKDYREFTAVCFRKIKMKSRSNLLAIIKARKSGQPGPVSIPA